MFRCRFSLRRRHGDPLFPDRMSRRCREPCDPARSRVALTWSGLERRGADRRAMRLLGAQLRGPGPRLASWLGECRRGRMRPRGSAHSAAKRPAQIPWGAIIRQAAARIQDARMQRWAHAIGQIRRRHSPDAIPTEYRRDTDVPQSRPKQACGPRTDRVNSADPHGASPRRFRTWSRPSARPAAAAHPRCSGPAGTAHISRRQVPVR